MVLHHPTKDLRALKKKVGDRNSFCFLQSHRRNVPPETALSKYAWSPWSPISVVTGRTSLCCFLLLLRPGDHQLGSLSMDRGISGNWDQAMGNRAKRKHWLFSTPETWLVWLVWLVINQNFFCEENCAWSHTLQKKSWFRSSGPHGFSWVCSSSHWILWKIWKVPSRDSVGKIQLCRIHIHERFLLYKLIPVVPGQAGGGSFKEKNYKSKKEFAYRMRDAQTISLLWTSLLLFHGGDVTCFDVTKLLAGWDEVMCLVVRWHGVSYCG